MARAAVGDVRYQLASLAYLGGSARPRAVLRRTARPALLGKRPADSGAVAFVGTAVAAGIVAWLCRPWPETAPPGGVFAPFEPLFAAFRPGQDGSLAGIGRWLAVRPLRGLARPARTRPVDLFRTGRGAPSSGATSAVTALWGARGDRRARRRAPAQAIRAPAGGPRLARAVLVAVVYFVGQRARRRSARLRVHRLRARPCSSARCSTAERQGTTLSLLFSGGLRARRASASASRALSARRRRTPEYFALLPLAAPYGAIGALVAGTRPRSQHLPLGAASRRRRLASWQLLDGTWLVLAWSARRRRARRARSARTGEKRLERRVLLLPDPRGGTGALLRGSARRPVRGEQAPRSGVPALLLRDRRDGDPRPAVSGDGPAEPPERPSPVRRVSPMRSIPARALAPAGRGRRRRALRVRDLADDPRHRGGDRRREHHRPTSSAATRRSAPSGACSASRSSTSASSAASTGFASSASASSGSRSRSSSSTTSRS